MITLKNKKGSVNVAGGRRSRNNSSKSDQETDAVHVPQWYPPGADAEQKLRKGGQYQVQLFDETFDENFYVPTRIASQNSELIGAVNDFHFAMMNDSQRNQFYWDSLKKVITPESIVVEIGTGSGLLAMMCAKLGAKHVTAIEANEGLATLARNNMIRNKLDDKITVLNKMSTEVSAKHLPHGKADILVSEILGTLLLSEGACEFNEDARKRLMKKDSHVIPRCGTQYVTLVQCQALDLITSVSSWDGIDFSGFNALKDTASLLFTKQIGYRLSSMDFTNMTERLAVLEIDFSHTKQDDLPHERRFRCQVVSDGTIHAAVFSWEVYNDDTREMCMSTHAEDTLDNFPRDMQWGQGVQMVDDHVAGERLADSNASKLSAVSVPLYVTKGEWIEVLVIISDDGVLMQCLIERVDEDGNAIGLSSLDA